VGFLLGLAVGFTTQRPEYNEYPDTHEVHVEVLVHAEQAVGHAVRVNVAQSELLDIPVPGTKAPL